MSMLAFKPDRSTLRDTRVWATLLAMLLLLFCLFFAWRSEQQNSVERAQQVTVQARIVAGSVAGALAFDDRVTAREYLDALHANRDIHAAAIYAADGELIAGYVSSGDKLPARVAQHAATVSGLELTVVEPVVQDELKLGNVYIRARIEPWSQRFSRYAGIGTAVLMAALMIVGLGRSHAAATAANRRLQEEIDAREKAESKLRQAQKMEAIGQLTGGVAHDFNNLLMAASSGLELLGRSEDPQRRDKLMQAMREVVERGTRLTRQLLTFARRSPLQKEVLDLRRRFDSLADLLRHSLRADIAVEYDVGADLWPIEVDPAEFDVAILNVTVNARDAMPGGGGIRFEARNEPGGLKGHDAVRIAIADTGMGMSEEQIARAFEPFYTTKGVGQGTGLGLSQVYGFVRSSGGTVSIESEPGRGITLTMILPRCERSPSPPVEKAVAPTEKPHEGCRVLLVEDDDTIAELATQMLHELGCSVSRRSSADAAIEDFDRAAVDMVITDMVMPGSKDGLDLARELRRKAPDLPILLMTGYSPMAGAAASEGFVVLSKPFRLADMAEHMAKILRGVGRRAGMDSIDV